MKKSNTLPKSEHLLREHKLKVTPSRVALLQVLIESDGPQSVEVLEQHPALSMNKTTIYRALEHFVKIGLLYQTHFRDGKTYYEYQSHHHHHISCTTCGKQEEIFFCISDRLPAITQQSQSFAHIQDHMLEFFGLCNNCNH